MQYSSVHRPAACLWRALFFMLTAGASLAAQPGPAAARLPGSLPGRIVVVCDDNYPPYVFRSADGRIQGIVPDLWREWERHTGIAVELRAMDWGAALSDMRGGYADVIDTIFYTEERDSWLDFTKPYATIDVPIFFHRDISGIAQPGDIRGFRVAAKEGDACVDILKTNGVEDIRLYPSYESIVAAAADGRERIFCIDEPPAYYFLIKADIIDRFRKTASLYSGQFHRAVREGDGVLLGAIVAGFDGLPRTAVAGVQEKWFGSAYSTRPNPLLMRTLLLAAIAGAVIAANMIVLAIMLRRKVASRTAELAEKVQELSASRDFHSAIMEALPDLLFVFDRDTRFDNYMVSPGSTYYVPPDVFVGKRVSDIFGPELGARVADAVAAALSGAGTQLLTYELPFQGEITTWEARIVKLGAEKALCISRDITQSEAAERKLHESLKEKEALLKEVHHRVKNNLQIISSLLSIQSEQFRDETDKQLLLESQNRIQAMAQVHEILYRSSSFGSIVIGDYLRGLSAELESLYGGEHLGSSIEVEADETVLSLDRAIPVGLLVTELVTNAYKYACTDGNEGCIRILSNTEEGGSYLLAVEDDGKGLPQGFDPRRGGGIGYTLIGGLCNQLGATLEASNKDPRGARIAVRVAQP